MKTKHLLGSIVVAVLAVFGVLGLGRAPEAQAAVFDSGLHLVTTAPDASSLDDNGFFNGLGFIDTSQKDAGFSVVMRVTVLSNSATISCTGAAGSAASCYMSAVSDKRLAGADNYNPVFGPRLDKLLPNAGASNTVPNTDSLLPYSGALLTQPVNTSDASFVPAPGSDDARLDIRTRDSSSIGYPNAHVTVLIDPKALAALIGDPNTVRVKAPIDGARYPMGNNLNSAAAYVDSTNLSLPNYLGVPNHVLTATIAIADPPASITVAAASTITNCGTKAPCTVTVKDSAGQNVFERTRVELATNFGDARGMTAFNGGVTTYLLTSTGHAGPYEVVAVTSRGTTQGLLNWTPTHVRDARDTMTSTFGIGSVASAYQVDTPTSAPVNAQATASSAGGGIGTVSVLLLLATTLTGLAGAKYLVRTRN